MEPRFDLALFGDPVAQSRSPAIHAEALRIAGLAGEYRAIRADRARLERGVDDLRAGKLQGINVTMPLKEVAARLVDVTTTAGQAAGSINSLRLIDGAVEGHSTDAEAFAELADQESFKEAGTVLVLGAGGSAMAVLAAIIDREVCLSARDMGKARLRARRRGGVSQVVPWGTAVDGALVVNATPLGMSGERLPDGVVEAASGLIDLPYGPARTPAVQTAERAGIPWVDGVEFLTRQAAASFRWWTGKVVDFEALLRVARNT